MSLINLRKPLYTYFQKVDTWKLLNLLMLAFYLGLLYFSFRLQQGDLDQDLLNFNLYYIGNYFLRVRNYLILTILVYLLLTRLLAQQPLTRYRILFLLQLSYIPDTLGNLYGWYTVGHSFSIIWYDNFVHLITPFIYAFLIGYVIMLIEPTTAPGIAASTAFGLAFALGSFFGVSEYISDQITNSAMIGGVVDVITDTIYDGTGSFLGAMFFFVYYRWYKNA